MTNGLSVRSWCAGLGVSLLLGASALGCGGGQGAASPDGSGSEVFKFQLPHTKYVRTSKWSRTISFDGSPMRRESAVTLRWQGRVVGSHEPGAILEETLDEMVLSADGVDVVRARPTVSQPVQVRYNFDRAAELTSIDGSFDAAALLQKAASGNQENKYMAIALRDMIDASQTERINNRVAGIVGRPARVGATWTAPAGRPTPANPEGTPELAYSVTAREACTWGQCFRVETAARLAPEVAAAQAKEAISAMLQTKDIAVKAASFEEKGVTVVDPETGLRTRGGDSTEAHYAVEAPKGPVSVTVKTSWESTFGSFEPVE